MLRWLKRLLLALLLAVAGYIAYAHIAWRDIPVAALEKKYGDASLKVAEVDGVPIRYRLEGSGPALVLIHNHFMDMGIWDAWVSLLSPHFTILRYDLAGHGLTGPDASGIYSVARDVELLNGLLNQLEIESAAVVGSSLGGNIAFTLAASHPERVNALVLVNSGGLKRDNSRSDGEIPGWADWIMPLLPPAAYERLLTWMIIDDSKETEALKNRFVDMWRREGNRQAELARLRQFDTGNPDPLLAKITAPTLILWGEGNPQLPVALAAGFQAKLSSTRTRLRIYPGAGHVLPVERPAASAGDTLSFLKALQ